MQAVILAGGLGSMIRPVLINTPKAMITVHDFPFLAYLLAHLKKNGIKNVVLAVGYLSYVIKNYFGNGERFGMSLIYSENHLPMGTGGAIKLAEPYLEERFFVINGDTYIREDYSKILKFHLLKKANVTIVVSSAKKGSVGGKVLIGKEGLVKSFTEGRAYRNSSWVNAGIYIFEKEILSAVPKKIRLSLEKEIFPKVVSKSVVYAFVSKHRLLEIGTPEGYLKVVKFVKNYEG